MKSILRLAIRLSIFILPLILLASESEKEFIDRIKASTVLIYSEDESGDLEFGCTGTVIGNTNNGYDVLTAAHCTKEDDETKDLYIATEDRNFYKAEIAKIGQTDYAILRFKSVDKFSSIPIESEANEYDGAPILNVSGRMGLGLQVEHGYISKLKTDRPVREKAKGVNWQDHMLLQLNASDGSSGSAVISVKNKAIIGIVVGFLSTGKFPIIIAVPSSKISLNSSIIDILLMDVPGVVTGRTPN